MSKVFNVLVLYPHNDPLDPQNQAARWGAGDYVEMTEDQLKARREAILSRFTSDPYFVEGEVKESAFGGEIVVPKLEPGAEVHLAAGVEQMLRAETTLQNVDAMLAKEPQLVAEGYKPETAQPFVAPVEVVVADDAPVTEPLQPREAGDDAPLTEAVLPDAPAQPTDTPVVVTETQPPADVAPVTEAAAEPQGSDETQPEAVETDAAPAADAPTTEAAAVEPQAEAAPAADADPATAAAPAAEAAAEAPAKKPRAKKTAEPAPAAE